jgi:hypothetical protein
MSKSLLPKVDNRFIVKRPTNFQPYRNNSTKKGSLFAGNREQRHGLICSNKTMAD